MGHGSPIDVWVILQVLLDEIGFRCAQGMWVQESVVWLPLQVEMPARQRALQFLVRVRAVILVLRPRFQLAL